MATFFEGRKRFEADFYFNEHNDIFYVSLDKAVAAKLLLFYEIFWETYNFPDQYGFRQYLSMDPEVDKCLIGVHWENGELCLWNSHWDVDELRPWNSSFYRSDRRVSYNTFMSAEYGHLGTVLDVIFDAIDYFSGIKDARILGRFAPEYVRKFIETDWLYIPDRDKDVFVFSANDLMEMGVVKPGKEPEDNKEVER